MNALVSARPARDALSCPDCGAGALRERGRIPDASEFAGQPLDAALPGGILFECRACALAFRWPVAEPAFYDALYARAKAGEWASVARRIDHEHIAAALQRHCSGGDVLDIGCGAGALLARLPSAYRRHGVEIGAAARRAAARAQVELVGHSFHALNQIEQRFDAVLAADVIEHHPRPGDFMAEALALLKPGGLLIVSTGNPDAALWRLCGGNFWYCQFAEHISFVSPRWLAGWSERSSQRSSARALAGAAQVVEVRTFAYAELPPGRWLKLAGLLLFYLVSPARYGRALARRRGWAGTLPYHATPPGTGLTRDHFVAVLRKPA